MLRGARALRAVLLPKMSSSTSTLVADYRALLISAGSPKIAAEKSAYFKHVALFHGVKSPDVEALTRAHFAPLLSTTATPNPPTLPLLWAAAEACLADDHHEVKQGGCLLLHLSIRRIVASGSPADALARLAAAFDRGDVCDWATSDALSGRVLGQLLRAHPSLTPGGVPDTLLQWASTGGVWKRRAAAVAFTRVADPSRGGLAPDFALRVGHAALTSPPASMAAERFLQLGVGWMVREVGVHSPAAAVAFLREHMAVVSREGLRYATEKMGGAEAAALVELHKTTTATGGKKKKNTTRGGEGEKKEEEEEEEDGTRAVRPRRG
jgi:hypothetical protein